MGSDALESDKLMRTLGLYRAAEAMLLHLDTPTQVAVSAYTKGVNAYLEAIKRGERQQPLEFAVFGITPQPWTDTDTVAWMKMMVGGITNVIPFSRIAWSSCRTHPFIYPVCSLALTKRSMLLFSPPLRRDRRPTTSLAIWKWSFIAMPC